jgi:phosphoserine/homoserine phosphotransferase
MYITCLDLEGVLVPEIWIAFAEETGIKELRLTTRDISDYDVLMKGRIDILKEHALGLKAVQRTIAKISPLDGAKKFLDELRTLCQVVILSDTFSQFALPLMKKLGMPAIFCNSLVVSSDGMITDYRLRQQNGKFHAIKAFKSSGFKTIASGDAFNDLAMIQEADAGFLFRAPERISAEYKHIPAFTGYDELLSAIKAELNRGD